jgi:Rad51
MGHACTYRIFLRKMGHDRIAIMYDSPYHAYDQVRFTISENGIEDSVEEKRTAEAIESGSSNESGW